MALRIINAGPAPEVIAARIQEAVEGALPGSQVAVRCTSPGHFEVSVAASEFQGKPRVRQHQLVYQAIAPLMSGNDAPVHAIDRLETRIP